MENRASSPSYKSVLYSNQYGNKLLFLSPLSDKQQEEITPFKGTETMREKLETRKGKLIIFNINID